MIRPIVDIFYFLKEISPFLSPLYIIGILTPLLIFLSLVSRGFPKKYKSFVSDFNYGAWSTIVIFNLIILFAFQGGFGVISDVLRYCTPIFLFYYIRHFIRSKADLIGVLQSFYYSAFIPTGILLYELIFEPINPEYLSESRGGGARVQGAYADIMNYAIYITGAFLIRCYFFLRSVRFKQVNTKVLINLGIVMVICFVGLISIKQTSSWAVIIFLIVLFLAFNLNNKKGVVSILLLLPIFIIVGQLVFKSKIEPLIEKEYSVIEGDAGIERSFNGRMTRWVKYFNIWFEEMPISSNAFGSALSGHEKVPVMISGGMHSDFVRIIFLSGVLGLVFYLMFFFNLANRVKRVPVPERFLIWGAIGSVLLYSISTTPLLYTPLIYCVYPIFAYAALPKPLLKKYG
ncbi:MAG: hypothetical protein JKY48_19660 [Flavobacteriales bacterium]|nr:hypothetical protein [Flavobacteriales bacterium]